MRCRTWGSVWGLMCRGSTTSTPPSCSSPPSHASAQTSRRWMPSRMSTLTFTPGRSGCTRLSLRRSTSTCTGGGRGRCCLCGGRAPGGTLPSPWRGPARTAPAQPPKLTRPGKTFWR
ncbi:hypothetical protein GWK47_016120 [Chionoecetes opilio]|uniref:Uncharacterized protein n=1 Tax=Chionoecetes opilio TaxID=41210 RepID=A0A8J4Y1S4_CHIOP|nr:hypothetical protein GWK47_016120 [Chionoecetes opilio]